MFLVNLYMSRHKVISSYLSMRYFFGYQLKNTKLLFVTTHLLGIEVILMEIPMAYAIA